MSLSDPGTRSPGFLVIVYSDFEQEHSASVRLVHGIDINEITALRTDAASLRDAIKGVLPPARIINGWRVLNPARQRVYEEAFSPSVAGTHTVTGTDWRSATVTLTGKGVPVDVLQGSGQTRLELFTGNAYAFARAQKFIVASGDAGLTALFNLLHANLRFFADFYGQHAEPRQFAPIQWNAHAQRRLGA